jgi:hypothetical protein
LPYSRLAEVNGKILCIGLGDNLVTIRHEAQYLAGLLGVVPTWRGVKFKDKDGKIKIFVCKELFGCVKKLPELVPHLRKKGIATDGKVGMANIIIAPAKESLKEMTEMLKNNPTLNLCDNIACLWCRELERRMSLFKEIKNPKYFQRSTIVIEIISIINWFRLRNYKSVDMLIRFIGNCWKQIK